MKIHLHEVKDQVTLIEGVRNQNTGSLGAEECWLPRKGKEGTFGDEEIVLCFDRGVSYKGTCICQK